MVDINLRFGENENEDNVLIFDDFELFMQEIELGIKIIEGSIWNKPHGLDINSYVFNKYISTFAMRNEIKSFITRECEHADKFSWDVDVKIIRERDEEFILITMTVHKGPEDIRTNKFLIS